MSKKKQPANQPDPFGAPEPTPSIKPDAKVSLDVDADLKAALGEVNIPAAFAALPPPSADELKSDTIEALTTPPAPVIDENSSDEAVLAAVPKVPSENDMEKRLAVHSEGVRQAMVSVLKSQWPAAYERYRAIKYQVPGVEPTLAQRRLAYDFVWRAYMAFSYRKSYATGE